MVVTIKRGTDKNQVRIILDKLIKQRQVRKNDLSKYCGVLSLKQDPLTLQNNWRDEW